MVSTAAEFEAQQRMDAMLLLMSMLMLMLMLGERRWGVKLLPTMVLMGRRRWRRQTAGGTPRHPDAHTRVRRDVTCTPTRKGEQNTSAGRLLLQPASRWCKRTLSDRMVQSSQLRRA